MPMKELEPVGGGLRTSEEIKKKPRKPAVFKEKCPGDGLYTLQKEKLGGTPVVLVHTEHLKNMENRVGKRGASHRGLLTK